MGRRGSGEWKGEREGILVSIALDIDSVDAEDLQLCTFASGCPCLAAVTVMSRDIT